MRRLVIFMAGIFSLLACNNEDSVESINFEDSTYSVVGRWYAERTDNPELDMFAEYTFTADGAVYVDEYRRRNGYKRDEGRGTYSIDGNRIVSNIASNMGLPIKNGSELLNLNSLTFTTRSKDYGDMQFLRIVGIVTPNVGDTLHLDVQQAVDSYTSQSVKVISCMMTDDAIASFDDDGVLIPQLIGVTYLKIETSIGNAALKISVSDNKNLWNDFSRGLGKSFDEVEKIFGKHYAFKSDSMRYFYDNPYVDSVDIYSSNNIVDSIVATLRNGIKKNDIIDYLDKKLIFIKDTLSYRWYTDDDNYLFSSYSVKFFEDNKKIAYIREDPQWDDRRDDYGLTADELLMKYGNYSGRDWINNTLSFNGIKNEFVGKITYHLNPTVYKYNIVVKMDISMEMINEYISRNFLYWNLLHPHVKNIQINGKEMILEISIKGNLSESYSRSMDYTFIENK